MGGRLYDSRIGRVLQADPPFMESPFWSQGLNRYSYVFNNPLNLVDPSGYMAEHDHPEDDDVTVSSTPTAKPVLLPTHSQPLRRSQFEFGAMLMYDFGIDGYG